MWIDVKESLPEWYRWVFVYSPGIANLCDDCKGVLMSRRVEKGDGKDGWYWDFSKYMHLTDTSITHWMPLPNPPEKV